MTSPVLPEVGGPYQAIERIRLGWPSALAGSLLAPSGFELYLLNRYSPPPLPRPSYVVAPDLPGFPGEPAGARPVPRPSIGWHGDELVVPL